MQRADDCERKRYGKGGGRRRRRGGGGAGNNCSAYNIYRSTCRWYARVIVAHVPLPVLSGGFLFCCYSCFSPVANVSLSPRFLWDRSVVSSDQPMSSPVHGSKIGCSTISRIGPAVPSRVECGCSLTPATHVVVFSTKEVRYCSGWRELSPHLRSKKP